MKVIVCGGRQYNNETRLYSILGKLHRERGVSLVIQGGAPGADTLAARWAMANDISTTTYAADWGKHGSRAGPIRNAAMMDEMPDAVVAFPGGRGTADMVRRAKAAGVPVWEIQP
jgi:predicted Rossmann-fold nucleotide-binding protein